MFGIKLKLCVLSICFKVIFAQNDLTCGVVKQYDNRIVRGQSIGYVKYPWFGGLFQATNPRQLACGASLVSRRYALTAAHCFKPYFRLASSGDVTLEEIYILKLGVNNVCVSENSSEVFEIEKVTVHEEYYKNLQYFDIALLLLSKEADFMPVCLPLTRYEDNNRTGLLGTVAGLGKEKSTDYRLPCLVKEGKVQVQDDLTCRQFLDAESGQGARLQDAFCAGSGRGDVDTCQGDSGGPLTVTVDNKEVLLGLTSFGYGCARKETYGVYTDVSHYLDWIHGHLTKEPLERPLNVFSLLGNILKKQI